MGRLRVLRTRQVNSVTAGFSGALTLERFFHDRSRCALGRYRVFAYKPLPKGAGNPLRLRTQWRQALANPNPT